MYLNVRHAMYPHTFCKFNIDGVFSAIHTYQEYIGIFIYIPIYTKIMFYLCPKQRYLNMDIRDDETTFCFHDKVS